MNASIPLSPLQQMKPYSVPLTRKSHLRVSAETLFSSGVSMTTFFITDNGAYMANWDTRGYEYNLRYKLPAKELEAISDDTVVRDMWVDSNLLILKDKSGHEVGFALNGKNAARAILKEISGK